VLLVIVRDVARTERDDFFFTTDLDADPADVVTEYHSRWAIEDTFRAVKQHLGGQQPQSWKGTGPERAAALDLQRDLVLVHPHPRPRPTLADPTLVSQQAHPQLPRRPRPTTNNPVAPTN